ncbi:hypothetical protein L873DRAFT_1842970 [Choiromyces venosus 120613-1]|uniref:Protein kinase domain-containing protein n=1 Tax=Choiromyces venosus 120613-1 TaxID=1336337 RepID=A0A3N4JQU1_9PEZI|nr:hypothetical protein L873DRAFT_1842970 [Choiromyces venosus 120613-1]
MSAGSPRPSSPPSSPTRGEFRSSSSLIGDCDIFPFPPRSESTPSAKDSFSSPGCKVPSSEDNHSSSPVRYALDLVNVKTAENHAYISLELHVVGKKVVQNTVIIKPETSPMYSAPDGSLITSPIHNQNGNSQPHARLGAALRKLLTCIPNKILGSSLFGNPWHLLEIQMASDGGKPQCNLVPTWSYQLLLSSLTTPAQLGIKFTGQRTGPSLNDRSEIVWEKKLGDIAWVGMLEGHTVFIKALDLTSIPTSEDLDISEQVDHIYSEMRILNTLPLHPYLAQAPTGYVALGKPGTARRVIGFITEYYKYGKLSEYIFSDSVSLSSILGRKRRRKISLLQKAKWALQMTTVLIDLHRSANMSLGDSSVGFGLERFYVDQYLLLHLSGFGKGAEPKMLSPWRFPPESLVPGEWEVKERYIRRNSVVQVKLRWRQNHCARVKQEELAQEREKLEEEKKFLNSIIDTGSNDPPSSSSSNRHRHHHRRSLSTECLSADSTNSSSLLGLANNDGGKELPTIFQEWRDITGALEVVETYSLGVMLWMMLEQVPAELLDITGRVDIRWSEEMKIPDTWRDLVEMCVPEHPGDRVKLNDVRAFFTQEVARLWQGGWVVDG